MESTEAIQEVKIDGYKEQSEVLSPSKLPSFGDYFSEEIES